MTHQHAPIEYVCLHCGAPEGDGLYLNEDGYDCHKCDENDVVAGTLEEHLAYRDECARDDAQERIGDYQREDRNG